MPAPANDNFAYATVLTGTSGFINAQTTVLATREAGELNIQQSTGAGVCPAPPSNETVWYSFLIPNTSTLVPTEMWFSAYSSTVPMEIQVFYVTATGAPTAWNYLQEVIYTEDNHQGIGYTNDAGVAVNCSPGTQYYIRVCSRAPSVDGGFDLVYNPYAPISLASCAACPPRIGIGDCFETLINTAVITAPQTSANLDFGIVTAGFYVVRYCGGAFNCTVPPYGLGTDPRQYPVGWFVANQPLTSFFIPHTFVVYNNPGAGADPGVSGSPVAPWGTIATFNIPLENPACVPNLLQTGTSLSVPLNFTGVASWSGGIPTYTLYANLLNFTAASASTFAACGQTAIEHLGGHIYLCYVIEDPLSQLPSEINITGSVAWGLYKINIMFAATGFSIVETDITTTGGPTDNNSSFSPVTPGPNLTAATFYFTNIGELAYTGVTVTLTGVTSPSAPQMINIPLGSNSVTFSFETPTTATTAVLSFTDAIGETFPVLSYNAAEFLIINTPTATAEPTCPTTITQFTFPIKNVGTLASAAGTRVDISFFACTTGGSDPGNVLGAGCATTGAGAAKTMILGAIAAGSTVNAFIECLNQPHGVVMTWKIALSGPGLSNVPPDYYFTYTWP